MARSKQNKSATKKVDGKYRHETREERRARLQQQQEAKEQCMKFLPHIGGAIFLFMIVFSLYVRSVPPVTVPKVTVPQPEFQGGTPEFTAVNTESKVNIAIEDTPAVDKEPNESEETIDL